MLKLHQQSQVFSLDWERQYLHLVTEQLITNVYSPARLIDSRSKLYKQLSELQNSKSMGILNDAEYAIEKEMTMDLLRQLKGQ